MGDEKLVSAADKKSIDEKLMNNPTAGAVVINLRVFNRMLTNFPELFSIKGKAILYRDGIHVYFHNKEDGIIGVKAANKEIESMEL